MDDYLQSVEFLGFSTHLTWMLALLVLLLMISALVSGFETALFSLSPNELRSIEEADTKQARAVVKLRDGKDRLLATVLIANNLVNVAAILVASVVIDSIVDFHSAIALEMFVKIISLTLLILLFGEIMPKVFASYKALSFMYWAHFVLLLQTLFKPISNVLLSTGGAVTSKLSQRKHTNLSMSELTDAIEIAESDSADDKKMLTGIVRFVKTEVDEIMKPRIDVVALELSASFADVKKTVVQSGFSRIPVYSENLDDIKGILYVKDLFPYLGEGEDFDWQQLLRSTYFVPEYKKINDLLEDFQKRKIHIAVVVDEYGGTLGLVSLEDILEEIVGEIADESDVEVAQYEQIDPNNYIFEGRTHLGDFLRILALSDGFLDSVRGDADTLAGLMLEIRGEFFSEGESVVFGDIEFTALRVENRRLTKIQIVLLTASDSPSSDDSDGEKRSVD